MTDRRGFLAGLLASGLAPAASWAEAGSPAYLTAAREASGAHVLVGLSDRLDDLFRIALPARGHAAAAHPHLPHAVAFARRPGLFALVIDCRDGSVVGRLATPDNRHFHGHGVFSRDGARLFTTENDYAMARGVIGIWDVEAGYARIGEIDSGGIGPHDMALMPDGQTLLVANGGIETHPDSGRTKLNIPTMQPNLTYLSGTDIIDQMALPGALRRNSIRHLSVRQDGLVAFAMQWQGDVQDGVPLAGTHRPGEAPSLLTAAQPKWREMQGYAGSIAFSRAGDRIGVTSPRGGLFLIFDADSGTLVQTIPRADVCGVAQGGADFVTTSGDGTIVAAGHASARHKTLAFDNHLVCVQPG